MGLFRVGKAGVILDPEAATLCKALPKVSKKEFLALVLWLDYDSKYKMFPREEMRRKALLEVFEDPNYPLEKNKLIPAAADEYMSLQYDPRRETIKTYETKISLLQIDILDEQSPDRITKTTAAIKTLNAEIREIQRQINMDDDVAQIEGGGKTSFIERYQMKQAAWNKQQDQINRQKNLKARTRKATSNGPLSEVSTDT